MKVTLQFETPDVVYFALKDITDEKERTKAKEVIEKFVEGGENLTVEIDTVTRTAIVLPVNR